MKPTLVPCLAAAFAVLTPSASARAAGPEAPEDPPPAPRVVRDDQSAPRDREPLRLGVLGGVGFPRPLSIEAMLKIARVVALGAEYSALPTMPIGSVAGPPISGIEGSMSAVAGDLRVFPFGGAFFLGARAGRQHLVAATTIAVPLVGSIPESMSIDEWFVNPRIGFLWTWDPGLTVGIDAGVQLPIASSTSTTLPPGALALAGKYYPDAAHLVNAVQWLGSGVLPTVDLLQVGLLF